VSLTGSPSILQSTKHNADRRERLEQTWRILRVIAAMEFKLKYADSALGYLWSIAKPMALFSVLYVVFGRFFRLGIGFKGYPIYLLIGIVLWTFFIDATSTTLPSIVSRGSLLRRLAFPRLVIPVSTTLTASITFAVNLIPVAVFLAWNRLIPRPSWLLLIPLLAELYVFTLGVGLILATLFVRYRDIGQVWELGSQLLFYAAPIIIPVGFLPPWSQPIAFLNPFVQIMQDVRTVVVYTLPHSATITADQRLSAVGGRLMPIAIAIGTLVFGLYLFRKQAPWFAEKV
jgi:ABC-2 type transport system permease protein